MSLIQDMKENSLFDKVTKEGIPFFQWHKWLEKTTNQEVLKYLFNKKQKDAKSSKDKQKVKEDLNQYLQETRRKSQI